MKLDKVRINDPEETAKELREEEELFRGLIATGGSQDVAIGDEAAFERMRRLVEEMKGNGQ
jgi:hypothetical protein